MPTIDPAAAARHYAAVTDDELGAALKLGPEGYSSAEAWAIVLAEGAKRGISAPPPTPAPSPSPSQPQGGLRPLTPEESSAHASWLQQYRAGLIVVDVDRSLALRVAASGFLPARLKTAHQFWSSIWLLSIPAAILIMIFVKWWVGLLILVLVTPAISEGTKRSAQGFIVEAALEDPRFYTFAVKNGVLRSRPA